MTSYHPENQLLREKCNMQESTWSMLAIFDVCGLSNIVSAMECAPRGLMEVTKVTLLFNGN